MLVATIVFICLIMETMLKPFALGFLLFALIPTSAGAQTELLSGYRWQNRLLLVFADNVNDPDSKQLRHALDRSACELRDRDMVIGWFHETGDNYIGTKTVELNDAQSLRDRIGASPKEFLAVLIGKDGGIKARYPRAPALSEVFDLIDGMPMRRSERRQRGLDCDGAQTP